MNKIILLCGPDGSGKSYLADQIMKKYPNHVYIHNAVTNDIKSLHENTVRAAILASEQHTVIIDRLHISEKVYGTLFRNGPSYDISNIERMLDETQRRYGNVVKIMCMVDKDTSTGIHSRRKESGDEMFDDNSSVWDMYDKELKNLSSSWKVYNWKTDSIDLNTFEVKKNAH